jgi:hypothetical protein
MATPINPAGLGLGVFALVDSGGALYAGGEFSSLGGQRDNLAALGVGTGRATAWHPHPGSEVDSLAVTRFAVYAGAVVYPIGK